MCKDPVRAADTVVKACRGSVPPYKYIAEVVRDLYLIAFNVWFWNYVHPEWVSFALELI